MKLAYIYLLMANLWIMLSWLVDGTFATFSCVFIGMIWLIGYVVFSHKELELMDLEFRLDRLKRHNEEARHQQIILLLETIAGKKKPKKK